MNRLIAKAAARLRHEGLSAWSILFWVKPDWKREFGLLDGRDTFEITRIVGAAGLRIGQSEIWFTRLQ